MGHTTELLCGQSALAPSKGSEHYLVAFYDKPIDAAGLFFWHPELHGLGFEGVI